MATKRYPLPRRFSAALSEKAYERLRGLNQQFGYGNNYLLTILLENFDAITRAGAVEQAFADFASKYGAPATGQMKPRK